MKTNMGWDGRGKLLEEDVTQVYKSLVDSILSLKCSAEFSSPSELQTSQVGKAGRTR